MPPQATPTDVVRARVMEGLATAVAEKGYAGATINDVVREARISKSTFYAHFADKEECYLAAYAAAAEEVLGVLRAAARPERSDDERIGAATEAYLQLVAAQPALARAFIVEVLAAGPAALAMRHTVNRRFADTLRELVDARRDRDRGDLSAAAAQIIVGGINELVLSAVVEDRLDELPSLSPAVAALVRAAVAAQPA